MPDPFARKTYLHAVPDEVLPVRFSVGKRTRALQLQSFFKMLQGALVEAAVPEAAEPGVRLELVVLTRSDWRRLLSAPYGWGLARHTHEGVSIALPAGYPPRLGTRLDEVRLRAARAGVTAPGNVTAFLDVFLGLEWAHAQLLSHTRDHNRGHNLGHHRGRKRPRAWFRELSASYLYQGILKRLGDTHKLACLKAWAELQQAGAQPATNDPQTFVYPRARTPLNDLLWTQGALWLQAAALGEAHGWVLTVAELQELAQARLKAPRAPL